VILLFYVIFNFAVMQENSGVNRPKVILLDVYETLLDMSDAERKVNNLLDSKRGYVIWFEMFLQYCFLDNCTGKFHDFPSIAQATMQMAGRLLGKDVSETDINKFLELLKHLPVHEEVPEGLSKLADEGFRIAALNNSPEKTIR
jgi:2-haloacid dehalogenase